MNLTKGPLQGTESLWRRFDVPIEQRPTQGTHSCLKYKQFLIYRTIFSQNSVTHKPHKLR